MKTNTNAGGSAMGSSEIISKVKENFRTVSGGGMLAARNPNDNAGCQIASNVESSATNGLVDWDGGRIPLLTSRIFNGTVRGRRAVVVILPEKKVAENHADPIARIANVIQMIAQSDEDCQVQRAIDEQIALDFPLFRNR